MGNDPSEHKASTHIRDNCPQLFLLTNLLERMRRRSHNPAKLGALRSPLLLESQRGRHCTRVRKLRFQLDPLLPSQTSTQNERYAKRYWRRHACNICNTLDARVCIGCKHVNVSTKGASNGGKTGVLPSATLQNEAVNKTSRFRRGSIVSKRKGDTAAPVCRTLPNCNNTGSAAHMRTVCK